MVKRCFLCAGETAFEYVTVEIGWDEARAIVENVPAWVCQQCRERYYDAKTSRALDRIRESPPARRGTVQIPIYSYAEAS